MNSFQDCARPRPAERKRRQRRGMRLRCCCCRGCKMLAAMLPAVPAPRVAAAVPRRPRRRLVPRLPAAAAAAALVLLELPTALPRAEARSWTTRSTRQQSYCKRNREWCRARSWTVALAVGPAGRADAPPRAHLVCEAAALGAPSLCTAAGRTVRRGLCIGKAKAALTRARSKIRYPAAIDRGSGALHLVSHGCVMYVGSAC